MDPDRDPLAIYSPGLFRGTTALNNAGGQFPAVPGQISDIQSFVRTRLAAHEYPRRIEFVDSLPMTATGKIMRRELRRLAEQDRGEGGPPITGGSLCDPTPALNTPIDEVRPPGCAGLRSALYLKIPRFSSPDELPELLRKVSPSWIAS